MLHKHTHTHMIALFLCDVIIAFNTMQVMMTELSFMSSHLFRFVF